MSSGKKPKIVVARHTPFLVTGLENFFDGKGEPVRSEAGHGALSL